ncbi:MAG: FadR/GntR family transcriptional regulator [Evtepia sp.]
MEAREYQKAIDCLCGLIEDGQLTVGDKLPTERALAEQLGISRNSTREALRALENLGVVERRQGSGSYLVGNTTKTIQPMIDMMLLLGQTSRLEICAFRRNMEKGVILAVLEKGTFPRWEEKLAPLVETPLMELSLEEQCRRDRAFHFTLIEATENRFWVSIGEAIVWVYNRWIDAVLETTGLEVKEAVSQAHRDMFLALKAGDRAACEAAIDRHYDTVHQALLETPDL